MIPLRTLLNSSLRLWVSLLRRPYDSERRALTAQAWRGLPQAVKSPRQVVGRHSMGCAATYGIKEACNFGCTACYLGTAANAQPPIAFEQVLRQLDAPSIFRVVLIHHPPIDGMMTHRKRLTDHAAFREVIARAGAELILHGHHHEFSQEAIITPTGNAAVIGAPACSACRYPGHLHASYHLCRLTAKNPGWRLEVEIRGLAETEDGFTPERTFTLLLRDDTACAPVSTATAAG